MKLFRKHKKGDNTLTLDTSIQPELLVESLEIPIIQEPLHTSAGLDQPSRQSANNTEDPHTDRAVALTAAERPTLRLVNSLRVLHWEVSTSTDMYHRDISAGD